MNWNWNAVRTAVISAILIVLHYTVRPLLAWNASIDFLIIALMFGAVRMRPGLAALFGFALGLVSDSLSPGAFGAAALGMSVVGFGASWLKAVFFADHLALNGFFIFIGKWVFDLIFILVSHRMHGRAVHADRRLVFAVGGDHRCRRRAGGRVVAALDGGPHRMIVRGSMS